MCFWSIFTVSSMMFDQNSTQPPVLIALCLPEPEILEELLKESPDIVSRRKECIKMVGALNQAEAM